MNEPHLIHGDALAELPRLDAASVDLIVADPPYHRVVDHAWDRQWATDAAYLDWIGAVCREWARVLRPNGSLYCFASPRMAARVECKVGETFAVLNRIRWLKSAGWHQKAEKEALRSYLSPWEEIIFAEHRNSDAYASGEAGYVAKCDEVRGFVFEPLRAYLDGERRKLGLSSTPFDGILGTNGLAKKYFNVCQWQLPTASAYVAFQDAYPDHFRREYEDLRREYEDLRREYEDLRRPFSVTADDEYTDVWSFPTVPARRGKHPCEKPADLLSQAIRASSRPGAVVLDSFMGSGSTGRAALALGRKFIGIERDPKWFESARAWIGEATHPTAHRPPSQPARRAARVARPVATPGQLFLFG